MNDQPPTPKFYPGEWVVVKSITHPEYNGYEFQISKRVYLQCTQDIKTGQLHGPGWRYFELGNSIPWSEKVLRPKPYGKPFHEMIYELKKVLNDQDRSNRNSKSEPEKVS